MSEEKVESSHGSISEELGIDVLEGQPCPICNENTLTLTEREQEIPYFGKVHLFSMTCSSCKFHKSDVEMTEKGEPTKYTIEVDSEEDMKIRVVKSSAATVKIPRIFSMTPGTASQGFVTNIEGIINRARSAIESAAEMSDDPSAEKEARNHIKKLKKATCGFEKLKIIIEDPTGNSIIISDKAVKSKL